MKKLIAICIILIVFTSYSQTIYYTTSGIDILTPDIKKMKTLIKLKYEFKGNYLFLKNDSIAIELFRLR